VPLAAARGPGHSPAAELAQPTERLTPLQCLVRVPILSLITFVGVGVVRLGGGSQPVCDTAIAAAPRPHCSSPRSSASGSRAHGMWAVHEGRHSESCTRHVPRRRCRTGTARPGAQKKLRHAATVTGHSIDAMSHAWDVRASACMRRARMHVMNRRLYLELIRRRVYVLFWAFSS
jgi:hypothetical protein